jgi:hypothetical protein
MTWTLECAEDPVLFIAADDGAADAFFLLG